MVIVRLYLYAIVALCVGGCAGTTPIKELTLPPVTTIEGALTYLDEGGFTLTDDSRSIAVRAKLANSKNLNLVRNDKVTMYGDRQGSHDRVFDGYVIRNATGEQIVVSNPAPHFSFIIHGSFE